MRISRVVVGLLVTVAVTAVLAFGVFPTRAYLDQRNELAASSRRVEVLERSTAALQQRVDRLHTDAEVERLAREQHNLILPGEEAFALLPAPTIGASPADSPRPVQRVAERESRSLWQQVKDRLNFWD